MQHMSSNVSGKAQKCSRIRPRKFVPFDKCKELSLENIDACKSTSASIKRKTWCAMSQVGNRDHPVSFKSVLCTVLKHFDLDVAQDKGDKQIQVSGQCV